MPNVYLSTLLCIFLWSSMFNLPAQTAEFKSNELIVQLSADVPFSFQSEKLKLGNPTIDQLNESNQIQSISQLVKSKPLVRRKSRPDTERMLIFTFKQKKDIPRLINQYMATGLFDYAEPNYIGYGAGQMATTPNDTWFSNQWSHYNDGTFALGSGATVDADIDMDDAWDITTGSSTIIAAILDSGTKLDHPELSGRGWNNSGDNTINSIDDDGNGYIDDYQGWDFVNGDNDPTDDHGHGTNVIGILGATGNNSIGYAGVDWNCKLMTCKILNSSNSGFYSWWTAAIYYAVDNGADVINMSVGGSGFSSSMQTAVNYAYANDVFIAVSMMNFNNNAPYYPAAYTNTIAVGATDTDDERVNPFFWSPTSGSNYGSHNDLCAPGNYMYGLRYNSNTNYSTYWGGTSQSAPLVTGVAALIKGLAPSLSVDSIRTILRTTADDQVGNPVEDTPGWDQYHGAGRMNAAAALTFVNSNLPVELVTFYGEALNQSVNLNWETASELNNRGFEVYRSNDREKWNKLGFVEGQGTSFQLRHYSFQDIHPRKGLNYYRLKQIDLDGNATFSRTIQIHINDLNIMIHPNPFDDIIYVTGGKGTLSIYNTAGQLVKEMKLSEYENRITTGELAKGNYLVKFRDDEGRSFTRRLTRE